MADQAAEGRANLERQKRFLLAVTVVVAAYFLLGARVCDTATYSGFLVTIAHPENARGILLVIWLWALLTYLQRVHKLVDVVSNSIKLDVEAEDYRLFHAKALRIARRKLQETNLGDGVTDVRIEGIAFKAPANRNVGEENRILWRREGDHYRSTTSKLRFRQFRVNLVGVLEKTSDRWDGGLDCSMEWGPWFNSWHVLRTWTRALIRRPGITEHFGPFLAVILTVWLAAHYWNDPLHPGKCRPSEQKIEATE